MITRLLYLVCVLFLLGTTTIVSDAKKQNVTVIREDNGGSVVDYIRKYTKMEVKGVAVKIDGECMSACTLLTGIISRENICVTSKAVLGFHAAGYGNPRNGEQIKDDKGNRVISESGTQLMNDVYPQDIRDWIKNNGGLNNSMIMLKGRELNAMFKGC